jgi:hypothetical protein
MRKPGDKRVRKRNNRGKTKNAEDVADLYQSDIIILAVRQKQPGKTEEEEV